MGRHPLPPLHHQLLKASVGTIEFYEQPDYERLVAAARELDPRIELLVLLGGDVAPRRGEIIALEQPDCDTRRGMLHVRRSEWKGHVTLPKGGRERQVNMTDRLRAVLTASKHLRSERVLWREDRCAPPFDSGPLRGPTLRANGQGGTAVLVRGEVRRDRVAEPRSGGRP